MASSEAKAGAKPGAHSKVVVPARLFALQNTNRMAKSSLAAARRDD